MDVLAAAPHDDVGGRRLCTLGLLVSLAATTEGGLGESKHTGGDAAHIAAGIGGKGGQEASAGLLGEVGLLEHALGAVHVRKVHD